METVKNKLESFFLFCFPVQERRARVHLTGNLGALYMCFFFVQESIYKMVSKNGLFKKTISAFSFIMLTSKQVTVEKD